MNEHQRLFLVQARSSFAVEAWSSRIRASITLAEGVEDLAPAIAQDGPNPEYPWPRANPVDLAVPLIRETRDKA